MSQLIKCLHTYCLIVAAQQFAMKTSFPAFSVPSRFRIFQCTSPNVENTRSTPALDATAISSDFHERVRFCFWYTYST